MIRSIRFFRIPILLLILTSPVFSQLNVKPAIIETELEHGKTSGSFQVTNVTDQEVRVRAMPGHFELNRNGNLQTIPISTESLANWLKLNPREFTIAPKAKRQIRYAVITPDSLGDGSYWCNIQFQVLPSADDSARARSGFVAVTGILVPFLVEKGEIQYDWSLNSDSITQEMIPKGMLVHAPIENLCPGRIPYTATYELRDADGVVADSGFIPRVSVFPNSIRDITKLLPADLPTGDYDFTITVVSEVTEKTLNGHTRVHIPKATPESP